MRYVKQTFGGLKEVDRSEAEGIWMSVNEYDKLKREQEEKDAERYRMQRDCNELQRRNDELNNAYYATKEKLKEAEGREFEVPDGMVLISQEEYNGYENAIRINRDKSLQQIDKSKADEHGYRLMLAEPRQYQKSVTAWYIKKSTPRSIKIPINEAAFLIKRDLKDFYGFRELPTYIDDSDAFFKHNSTLTPKELLRLHERHIVKGEEPPEGGSNKVFYDFLAANHGKVAFEVDRISGNQGSGCYEVAYWATEPI